MFLVLKKIKETKINDSQLKYLEKDLFIDLRNLVSLNLSNNQIMVLETTIFQSTLNLE